MTKITAAKHKIDRRLGVNLWGRPKSPVNSRNYGPGQHGQERKGKISDYGIQLNASLQVPTANENRPRSIAFNYIVRAA